MLIELVKQYAFTDLMSSSPFFFDKTFANYVFVVTMTKQNHVEIMLKDPLNNWVCWKINKLNKQEVILVNYKELVTITDSHRVMIWSALKKLMKKQYVAILLPEENDGCLKEILKIEREKEVVSVSNNQYIYIPC